MTGRYSLEDGCRMRMTTIDFRCWRSLLVAALVALYMAEITCADEQNEKETKPGKAAHENLLLRGRVVFLADALKRRYGIETDADAARQQVALETADGELYPLVKDARGRGFLLDARLRDIEMELLVRRHIGSPVVQVIRVYTIKDDGRHELDYWCDVCAIPMYELKQCECCQGPIRLRERKAADGEEPRKSRK